MTTDLMPVHSDLSMTFAEERGGITPAAALNRRIEIILDVMANVLEPNKDYGVIPGTDKPSLFKPGAEKLCLTFNLATAEPIVDDLGDGDIIRYRVRVPLLSPTGRVLSVGIGAASTGEEKYKWRRPVCDEEFEETPDTLRREKWVKARTAGGSATKIKQVRTVSEDLDNTVLKMAHKRAYIHATLLATGASSVFNQDLEHFTAELAESLVEGDAETSAGRSIAPPQRRSTSAAPAAGVEGVIGVLTKCTKISGQWHLTVKDDARDFTAREDTIAQPAVALIGRSVRLTFTSKQGERRTFYNVNTVEAFEPVPAAAPAAAAAPAPAAVPTTPPVTADRIPFGDEPRRREPGEEG